MQNKTNDQNCKFTYNANAIGTCLNKPKHTSFKDLSARFQSFQGCNFCGDIEETAKAGFFHTGIYLELNTCTAHFMLLSY